MPAEFSSSHESIAVVLHNMLSENVKAVAGISWMQAEVICTNSRKYIETIIKQIKNVRCTKSIQPDLEIRRSRVVCISLSFFD
jgi:hypothetical protein